MNDRTARSRSLVQRVACSSRSDAAIASSEGAHAIVTSGRTRYLGPRPKYGRSATAARSSARASPISASV